MLACGGGELVEHRRGKKRRGVKGEGGIQLASEREKAVEFSSYS